MIVSDIIFGFICKFVGISKLIHNRTFFQNLFPKLHGCDFHAVVSSTFEDKKYVRLYNAFMVLFSSQMKDGMLFDQLNSKYITFRQIPSWSLLILQAFYYFKLVFPAPLLFFTNSLYDSTSKAARELIMQRYFLRKNVETDITDQYDLCGGWNLKVKFLRKMLTKNCFYPFNLVNNQLLLNTATKSYSNTHRVVKTKYLNVEHIATTLYRKYSYLVDERRFIVCKEKTLVKRFSNVYCLQFTASYDAKSSFESIKLEKHIPLYFLFKKDQDLRAFVQIHNACVRLSGSKHLTEISISQDQSKQVNAPLTTAESFVERLSKTMKVRLPTQPTGCNFVTEQDLRQRLEETGFISVYDMENSNTLTYVKNRVVHLTAMFRGRVGRKPFYEKKRKPLVKVEKMVKNITMTRYKTKMSSRGTISFNMNYLGSLGTLQLALSRFLNETKDKGCCIPKSLWVSNVCTTLDTVHSGILNTHIYRNKCLKRADHLSYQMMNFPAVVTHFNNENNTSSIINNRTSINTCGLYGKDLTQSLESCVDFIQRNSETDSDLIKTVYELEKQSRELLPRNCMVIVQLLHLLKDEFCVSPECMSKFLRERFLFSRLITTTNRSFSTSNTYIKVYKSDAIDNVSIKSEKYQPLLPPVIRNRERLYNELTKKYRDVGSLNRKMFRQRGRNANLLDLILNAKDSFFVSKRCKNLLSLLSKKYAHLKHTSSEIDLILDHLTEKIIF